MNRIDFADVAFGNLGPSFASTVFLPSVADLSISDGYSIAGYNKSALAVGVDFGFNLIFFKVTTGLEGKILSQLEK